MHNLVGEVFDRLSVVEPVRQRRKSGRSVLKWRCQCSCGNECTVITSDLLRGKQKSCGCLKSDNSRKHGMSDSKEYRAYIDMISRCYKDGSSSFEYYGARGISVCDRWRESFENFYEDMGSCGEGLSLERIDVHGNYSPENCEWASWGKQMANRGIAKNNTSGRTGVYKTPYGRWCAQIKVEGRVITLGNFENFDDACFARENAELKYFGFIKK